MALRAARETSGKTQKQVASESDITERMYQRYEEGTSTPLADTAARVAKAVNSTVEAIWGDRQQSTPDGNQANQ